LRRRRQLCNGFAALLLWRGERAGRLCYRSGMNATRLFLRMARLARHPPKPRRVAVVFIVLGICLILFGLERIFGWPSWLTPQRMPRGVRIR
jgi:hypothetical protein